MPKTKILVVDDDEHIAELISLYLAKEGYETRQVHDGNKALEEFQAFQPSLVMHLILCFPGMDGYQVLSGIRKKGNTPVIMLTAKGRNI